MNQPINSIAGSRAAMFLLGATLALGFTLSAYILSSAVQHIKRDNTIKVKGVAETTVESDSARWKARYTVRNPVLALGYAQLELHQAMLIRFLTEANVPEDECAFSAVAMKIEYKLDNQGHLTNELQSYILTQAVEVKSNDVHRIQKLSKTVTQLIKSDIEIESLPPEYVCSTVEKIKLDLLGKATQNAYDRAKALADNSHGRVGVLSSASQGVFQITPVDSTEVTDYGSYDTTTIKKSVKAVVTLEFQIEK